MVKKFVVKGADETVENVEILGSVYTPGTIVELEEEAVASLVEEGKLALAEDQGSDEAAKDGGEAVADAGQAGGEATKPEETASNGEEVAKPEGAAEDKAPGAAEA